MENQEYITPIHNLLKKIDSIYGINKYLHKYKETPQFNYKISNIKKLEDILYEIINYHFKKNTIFTNDIPKKRIDEIIHYVEILLNKMYKNVDKDSVQNIAKLLDLIFGDLKNFYKEVKNTIKYNKKKSKKDTSISIHVIEALGENLSKNIIYVFFMLFYNTNVIPSKKLINKIITILNINYKNYHLIINKCQNIIDKSLIYKYNVCNFVRNKEIDKILKSLNSSESPKSKSPRLESLRKSLDLPLPIKDGLLTIIHIINTLQGFSDKSDSKIINDYFTEKEKSEKSEDKIEEKENKILTFMTRLYNVYQQPINLSEQIVYPQQIKKESNIKNFDPAIHHPAAFVSN